MELLKVKKIFIDDKTKKVIDDMVNEVKNDSEVFSYLKERGITNELLVRNNIGTIISFKEDLDYCRKCPGYNLCNKNHPHFSSELTLHGNRVDNNVKPCKYEIQNREIDSSYIIKDFPAEWREIEIAKLDRSNKRLKLIKLFKEKFMSSHENWLYITGNHRCGKSIMACGFINDYINTTHNKVAYINYPFRVRELVDLSFQYKEAFEKKIAMYCTVGLLVIDDFGNEYKNEFIRDSITLTILNERARNGLMTIFTSEFNYDDIANMYSLNMAGKARGKQIKNLLADYAGEIQDISSIAIY